ncbi:MAG: hypothetical protein OXG83_04015 [Acidobacteria bacterium]|nr:hypothetical protein [Acidobacteriota bacterium]
MIGRPWRAAPVLWLVGSTLILAGERYAASDILGGLFLGIGTALAITAVGACAAEFLNADRGSAAWPQARRSLGFYGLAALGLLLYPLTWRGVVDRLGFDDDGAGTWRAVWTVAWLLAWWVGTVAAVGGDWTRYRGGGDLEPRRVRAATAAAASLALAGAWVFALNYSAREGDRLWEWSARSRARVSEATLELVGGLRDRVEVVAFFPPANQVLRRIGPFLDEVAAAGPVDVTVLDQALEPTRAAELGARENGVLFLLRGGDQRRIDLGTDYDRAKSGIGSLDRDFQEALLEIGRERRTLYLTVGHGERGEYAGDAGVPGMRNARGILRALNVTTRDLSVTDLIQGLPADTGLVAVFGPTERFLPEEVDSLRRFWSDGSSLLLLLEPGVEHGLEPLLAELGVRQLEGTVANERYHLRRDGALSDRRLLLTNRFGSHETVRDLSRAASRIGLVLDGASGLEGVVGGPARPSVLVRPMTGSWLELDGNFERDAEAEPDRIEALAMASEREVEGAAAGDSGEAGVPAESRAIVIGDADTMNDDFVYVTGPGTMSANAKLLLDAYVWLAREDETAVSSVPGDDDPVLQRTRGESIRWFLGTVFGVPVLVLAAGFVYVRARRSAGGAWRRGSTPAGGTAGPAGGGGS